jgi:hypothetical protein
MDYLSFCHFVLKIGPGDMPSIPYFPAPKDAPDSCSCNLGTVYNAVRAIKVQQGYACRMNENVLNPLNLPSVEIKKGTYTESLCRSCEIYSALSR